MEQYQPKLKTVSQGDIPAPATQEFMEKVNIQMTKFEGQMEMVCQKLNQNTEEHKEIMAKMDKFIEGCEKKFATKLIEKIVYIIVGIFALAALYFIFNEVGLPH